MAKIKICGIKSMDDIEIINRYRPDFCGFIINFPKSHRSRTKDQVRELVGGLDRKNISPVGVFVDEPLESAAELMLDGTIDMAQLHGNEDEAYIKELRRVTGMPVIKAFQINGAGDIEYARKSPADFILLDRGQGSGQTFDWSLLADMGRPWFLAGGIDEGNLPAALDRYAPYAVDLSSSVETDRKKDAEKICRVVGLVRERSRL